MSGPLALEQFLLLDGQLIDVRSPQEFAHAHIPGAISVPLFSNEQRAEIGTVYKQVGKESAIALGVSLVGPRLFQIFNTIKATNGIKKIYCWRGGMRSGFVCSFLQSIGIESVQLNGGYKAFRRKMLALLDAPPPLCVLAGMTGSGKTEVLAQFPSSAIDLEALACHRGSAFGELPDREQPSNEQFENCLGFALYQHPKEKMLLVEDESRMIGRCVIPNGFYAAMQKAPFVFLECSKSERVDRICSLYGSFSKQWWKEKIYKIQKRLGAVQAKKIASLIAEDDLPTAVAELLSYYDASYQHALKRRLGPCFLSSRCSVEALLASLLS